MKLCADELEVLRIHQDQELPRHTSYPSVPYWRPMSAEGARAIEHGFTKPEQSAWGNEVEVYIHIPFCAQLCLYCGCNRQTMRRSSTDQDLVRRVLWALVQEIRGLAKIPDLEVVRVHFGGGTPNFLKPEEFSGLVNELRETLGNEFPISVEIDARHLTAEFAATMGTLNCTWASLGVQELDPNIQKLIGRVQSLEKIADAVTKLKEQRVQSLNFDLIYGLPLQTRETWLSTIHKCLELNPERFSLFRFALLPKLFPWQKSLLRHGKESLPNPLDTAEFFLLAKSVLEDAGYVHVGLDHFAKHTDSLAVAALRGDIARSFQGVVEKKRLQIVGLGSSAVSFYHGVYAQKQKELAAWLQSVETHGVSHASVYQKFYELDSRDTQQFALIQKLYACGVLSASDVASQGPSFELAMGQPKRSNLVAQGILEDAPGGELILTPKLGKLLARVVASSFDDHWTKAQSLSVCQEKPAKHSAAF